MNVLNPEDIERQLTQLGARAVHSEVKHWLMTVVRKFLLTKITETDELREYEKVDRRPRARERFSLIPSPLPDWAALALTDGRDVHFWRNAQPRTRPIWKDVEAIIDWFNATMPKDARVLNRLSRLSFTQARSHATQWLERINADPWLFVKDKPPVMLEMDGGWRWVKLVTPAHTRREAHLMNNCINSPNYLSSDLYSLRDPDNRPHVSMEVEDGKTLQVKGNSNQKAAAPYQPYIRLFLMHMKIKLVGDAGLVD